jgi:hypothetical protein
LIARPTQGADEAMNNMRLILSVVLIAAWSSASAETMKFEDSAGLLGASCAKDIETNCRGVNLDPVRMKDCLYRNQDSLSEQCKANYSRALDGIQKRTSARTTMARLCQGDAHRYCGGAQKVDSQAIICLLGGPRGISLNCNKAITEAGYR